MSMPHYIPLRPQMPYYGKPAAPVSSLQTFSPSLDPWGNVSRNRVLAYQLRPQVGVYSALGLPHPTPLPVPVWERAVDTYTQHSHQEQAAASERMLKQLNRWRCDAGERRCQRLALEAACGQYRDQRLLSGLQKWAAQTEWAMHHQLRKEQLLSHAVHRMRHRQLFSAFDKWWAVATARRETKAAATREQEELEAEAAARRRRLEIEEEATR